MCTDQRNERIHLLVNKHIQTHITQGSQITKSSLTQCKATTNARGFVVVDSVVNLPNFRTIGTDSSDPMYLSCPIHLFQKCFEEKFGRGLAKVNMLNRILTSRLIKFIHLYHCTSTSTILLVYKLCTDQRNGRYHSQVNKHTYAH